MNAQERIQLDQFLRQLCEVKLTDKDNEAESLIHTAVDQQADAAYLLVQRCLIQDRALQAAEARIADLQNRLKPSTSATGGFLDNDPWAPASSKNDGVPGVSDYQVPNTRPPGSAAFRHAAAPSNQNGNFDSSGFLGNIATTAAGVVAGSFLYHGIGNLLGHHTSPLAMNQPQTNTDPLEQTVINNYYGSSDQFTEHETDDNYLSVNDGDSLLDDSDFDSDWV